MAVTERGEAVRTAAGAAPRSAAAVTATRMLALGRAEATLMSRNKTALYMALLMPVFMVWAMRSATAKIDIAKTGMSVNETSLTGAFGFVLIFAVYQNLSGAFVARREELVLKRLRTSEASDPEILAGSALPAVGLALAQCVVLLVAGAAWLHLRVPARPDLLIAGFVLGVVLFVALAAVTAAGAKTAESAQLLSMPLLLLSVAGSGMVVPLTVMPDVVGDVCKLLPMTPVVELMRGGWLGTLGLYEALGYLGTALAWVVLAVFAVRKWFRWESRR
ncbi:ABC transporter permease [Streptomyces sp. NPDC050617]|uniref:ABC transporter permease n=1 Tax=Streptomyces sp. NPDC050617 TaxID=3154628 RepID=UPI0034239D7F